MRLLAVYEMTATGAEVLSRGSNTPQEILPDSARNEQGQAEIDDPTKGNAGCQGPFGRRGCPFVLGFLLLMLYRDGRRRMGVDEDVLSLKFTTVYHSGEEKCIWADFGMWESRFKAIDHRAAGGNENGQLQWLL